MKSKSTIFEQSKKLVILGKTNDAILLLKIEGNLNETFTKSLSLIESNYNRLNEEEIDGVITSSDFRTAMNQINKRIFSLIERMETTQSNYSIPTQNLPSNLDYISGINNKQIARIEQYLISGKSKQFISPRESYLLTYIFFGDLNKKIKECYDIFSNTNSLDNNTQRTNCTGCVRKIIPILKEILCCLLDSDNSHTPFYRHVSKLQKELTETKKLIAQTIHKKSDSHRIYQILVSNQIPKLKITIEKVLFEVNKIINLSKTESMN